MKFLETDSASKMDMFHASHNVLADLGLWSESGGTPAISIHTGDRGIIRCHASGRVEELSASLPEEGAGARLDAMYVWLQETISLIEIDCVYGNKDELPGLRRALEFLKTGA